MHGDFQHLAFSVPVRIGDRTRPGFSRFKPGSARDSCRWSRNGRGNASWTWPRHSCPAAVRTISTSRSRDAATMTSAQTSTTIRIGWSWRWELTSARPADRSILDEGVPYDNQPGTETPLYEHLQRAIQYTLDRMGPHGLPLIGRADWNDCLNLNSHSETPGESFPDDRTG